MNELDSEVMAGVLEERGLTPVSSEEEADIVIYNTCSVRDLADRKILGKLGLLSRKSKKNVLIGLAGCIPMIKKEELLKEFPLLDFILGTNNIMDLNQIIDEALTKKCQIAHTKNNFQEPDYSKAVRKDRVKAYVSVIRGCNKFCTYCIVPYTRGREISRPLQDIVKEVKRLVFNGYKEITLLGQNVNSYGKDLPDSKYLFHDLLYELDKIEELKRIRFLTSHPVDITQELILAIRDLPSVCEFVHFPLQSGSNLILKRMNRGYTKEQYLEKVGLFKKLIPEIHLGTDIIVGFPGESDEDFKETEKTFQEIGFSASFIFAYSPRKKTAALRFKDDVPPSLKQERLQKLLSLHEEINNQKRQQTIGSEVEVLVDSINSDGSLKGRTRRFEKVVFRGEKKLLGNILKVTIHSFIHDTLLGTI